jgi:hypothetical protein
LEYCFVLENQNPFYNFDNNEVLVVVVELNDIVAVVDLVDFVIVVELGFLMVAEIAIGMDYLTELDVTNYY